MTLCGDSRKGPISSGSSAGFVWESEAWSASSWDPGCKSRGWNIVPSGPLQGQKRAAEPCWAQGRDTAPAAARADSQGSPVTAGPQAVWAVCMEKQELQIQHSDKDRDVSSGQGGEWPVPQKKNNGFWIASYFAKYQVCPSERSLTQAT